MSWYVESRRGSPSLKRGRKVGRKVESSRKGGVMSQGGAENGTRNSEIFERKKKILLELFTARGGM